MGIKKLTTYLKCEYERIDTGASCLVCEQVSDFMIWDAEQLSDNAVLCNACIANTVKELDKEYEKVKEEQRKEIAEKKYARAQKKRRVKSCRDAWKQSKEKGRMYK